MEPKQIWANLGVKDVGRTREFYTAIGFKSNEGLNKSNEIASFLIGEDDFVVHFFAHEALHPEYRDAVGRLKNNNEVLFTLSAESIREVDDWAREVRDAGGTIFSEPKSLGGDYYGFGFADPDGHKWNVFHM